MDFIRGFDAFPKIESSYKKQTIIGGITSVIVGTFLITLVLSEVILYLKPSLNYSFVVDSNIDQNIQINLDISVATPCSSLITIATDVSNETLVLNNFLSAKKVCLKVMHFLHLYSDKLFQSRSKVKFSF